MAGGSGGDRSLSERVSAPCAGGEPAAGRTVASILGRSSALPSVWLVDFRSPTPTGMTRRARVSWRSVCE